MILANNLQTFWDNIFCNKKWQNRLKKRLKATKPTSSGGNQNGKKL